MARHHRKAKSPRRSRRALAVAKTAEFSDVYGRACRLAADGKLDEARRLYAGLEVPGAEVRLRALVLNDLATLDAVAGEFDAACRELEAALAIDESCRPARLNLELLVSRMAPCRKARNGDEAEASAARSEPRPPINAQSLGAGLMTTPSTRPHVPPARLDFGEISRAEPRPPINAEKHVQTTSMNEPGAVSLKVVGGDGERPADRVNGNTDPPGAAPADFVAPIRIAIVSFLFNWPSTGGGNIHTVELATFLGRAGYDVRHFYVRYPEWGIGRVGDALPFSSEGLEFGPASWNLGEIQGRYRHAVQSFDPDYVLITDAWNMKPILAEAVEGYPYYLRFQALECLCPLNNLRLLARGPETVEQCPRDQLANPDVCRRCLVERGHHSGSLHQWERALCQVGTPAYDRKLRRAMEQADAVLVLNPLIGALLEPFAQNVRVVPWGMDSSRFPWPPGEGVGDGKPTGAAERGPSPSAAPLATLFMAAVRGEFIKGYHVAREACRLLRQSRSDFELVVTFDPPGRIDEFTRSVGWCSQADLPRHYHAAAVCLVPTIAQEGLSRTSVEAMASGIPVIASRIGGLPFTVSDGVTGLLFEPGDPADLAEKTIRLLDDAALRRRMGLAGRKRFEDEFMWETVIERHYRPLLAQSRVGTAHR